MRKFKNKHGFTLIEIIVVLIIIGILAAVALPNLFGHVRRSRGAEALAALGTVKQQIEGCIAAHPNTIAADCDVLTFLPTQNFTYAFGATLPSGGNYVIQATDTGNAANTISLTRTAAGGFTCAGAGDFAQSCP